MLQLPTLSRTAPIKNLKNAGHCFFFHLYRIGAGASYCIVVAQIAQLVEQRTENPRVAGSIPALGTMFCSYPDIMLEFCYCN